MKKIKITNREIVNNLLHPSKEYLNSLSDFWREFDNKTSNWEITETTDGCIVNIPDFNLIIS